MVVAMFSDVQEFLKELKAIERQGRRLRLSVRRRGHDTLPLQSLSVMAGFIDSTEPLELVVLQRHVGNVGMGQAKEVIDEANKIIEEIESAAKSIGMHIDAGMYLFDNSAK